jgi:hypothetical protein
VSELDVGFQRAVELDDVRDVRRERASPSTASHWLASSVNARKRAPVNARARGNSATSAQLWRLNELGLLEVRWDRVGEPVQKDHATRLLSEAREKGRW